MAANCLHKFIMQFSAAKKRYSVASFQKSLATMTPEVQSSQVRSKLCINPLNHHHNCLGVGPSWRQNILRKHFLNITPGTKTKRKLPDGKYEASSSAVTVTFRIFSVSTRHAYIFCALESKVPFPNPLQRQL